HGCPPEDQENICKYLLKEKQLHTYVKLNPTLLGFDFVQKIFAKMGYKNIELKEDSFRHDLQFDDAVEMISRLKVFALENKREFGVKLSNTLPVRNAKQNLPGNEMYLSGRALYPLTINLAAKLANEFEGDLPISYSGGADIFNIKEIFQTGIQPITMATVLFKPGGYFRLQQIADTLAETDEKKMMNERKIDVEKLQKIADESFDSFDYFKERKPVHDRKIEQKLPLTDCYIAPCIQGCPIDQDIPEYIRLVSEKRYREALEVVLSKNPLPFITGYICDHKCMLKCTRLDYEDPVLIREMKKIAAEKGFEKNLPEFHKFVKSDENIKNKVAIIGAGPSGLSCGYFLSKAGFDVTIFEKTGKPGGVVQHTIPNFRIPRKAIDNDLEIIKSSGVKIRFYSDENFSIKDMKDSGFEHIVLAIGAGKSRRPQIDGNSENIMEAIEFLKEFNKKSDSMNLGKYVAVIGGGNSAMDAARAALRVKSVEKVYILYRRTQEFMPADNEELENAIKDGVIFKELLNPVSFHDSVLKCSKMKLGEPDKSGRKRPIPIENSFEKIEIDFMLSAIGEVLDYDILQQNGIKVDSNWNFAVNKETNETNIENVYIGGDAFRGPATVVDAIADGTKIAKAIISKTGKIPENFFEFQSKFNDEKRISDIISKKGEIKVGFDLKTTNQLSLDLSETSNEEIIKDKFRKLEVEAERCLECNFICNICAEVCPNRANIPIKVKSKNLKDIYQIIHLDGMCNECGNCETFCPYNGAPYKDKFTLFGNKDDFLESQNNGFVILDEQNIKLRFNHIIYNLFLQNNEIKSCNPFGIFLKEIKKLVDIISTILRDYKYFFKKK
nr:putative selenate reductase subunit YgfK [Candidatus Cloacimonadota bacterium]